MKKRPKLIGAVLMLTMVLFQSGCALPIPREEVPEGWSLNVHQPGEWWTEPVIPRAVVLQRCPPPFGWWSDPDLTWVTGMPPGGDIEYSFLFDDYHCLIGWAEPASDVEFSPEDMTSEAGLRRICSSSGLPMDESWRFLGHKPTEQVGDPLEDMDEYYMHREATTAAFIDDHGTVVGCMVEHWGSNAAGAFVELSVGAEAVPADAGACPVTAYVMGVNVDDTLWLYLVRGAGAVRDDSGTILSEASMLEISAVGDSLTSRHPVVDGVAIVDASVHPAAAIHVDMDEAQSTPIVGRIHGPDGKLLATCQG